MQTIDTRQWTSFANRFTSEHDGWSASLQLREPSGAIEMAIDDRPFRGLTIENHLGNESIILTFGDDPDEHLTHIVEHPRSVTLEDAGPTQCSLIVGLADGSGCVLELASPYEMV
jgi:hypothetical protein